MTVIDSIHENGAKLVEMSPESVSDLQAEQPGLRIVPVVYYYPAKAPRPMPSATPKAAVGRPQDQCDGCFQSESQTDCRCEGSGFY